MTVSPPLPAAPVNVFYRPGDKQHAEDHCHVGPNNVDEEAVVIHFVPLSTIASAKA